MIQQNNHLKFRKRNWVEKNDKSQRMYNESNHIKFKTSRIRSNLCDYRDAYIHVKGAITFTNTAAENAAANNRNKGVTFNIKLCFIY